MLGALTDAGREWIVDATGCPRDVLRDLACVRGVIELLIDEAHLRPIAPAQWHVFAGEGGVTGLVLLAESHVAVHTFPELGLATCNLYCCRPRPRWSWEERLAEHWGATRVIVRELVRGR